MSERWQTNLLRESVFTLWSHWNSISIISLYGRLQPTTQHPKSHSLKSAHLSISWSVPRLRAQTNIARVERICKYTTNPAKKFGCENRPLKRGQGVTVNTSSGRQKGDLIRVMWFHGYNDDCRRQGKTFIMRKGQKSVVRPKVHNKTVIKTVDLGFFSFFWM